MGNNCLLSMDRSINGNFTCMCNSKVFRINHGEQDDRLATETPHRPIPSTEGIVYVLEPRLS